MPISSWEIACMVDPKLAEEMGILHTGEILTFNIRGNKETLIDPEKRIYDTRKS